MNKFQSIPLLLLVIILAACNSNIDKNAIESTQAQATATQADITKTCKDKYFRFPLVKYALHQAFGDTNIEKLSHRIAKRKPDCVTINNDTANKTITIDYGTNCSVGRKNKTKTISGKLVITYTGKPSASGGGYTVEAQKLIVDSQAVTFKKTVTNLESSTTSYKVNVKTEATIALTSGITPSISNDITKTVTLGTDGKPTSKSKEGTTSLTDAEGKTYAITITKAVVSNKACATTTHSSKRRGHGHHGHHGRRGRHHGGHGKGFPVSGTKTIESAGKSITIDFGDGTCDKKVTITSGTETKEVDFATETTKLKDYIKTYFN